MSDDWSEGSINGLPIGDHCVCNLRSVTAWANSVRQNWCFVPACGVFHREGSRTDRYSRSIESRNYLVLENLNP